MAKYFCSKCGGSLSWIQHRDIRYFPPYDNAPKWLLDNPYGYYSCDGCGRDYLVREVEDEFR